jgi:methyl-accepting chemotaxis protein
MDTAPVTVFRISNESRVMRYINKNVEKLTGYSKKDFTDQKILWSDIVFPEDALAINHVVENAIKNKIPYQVEYRIKKSDDSTVFIQEQAELVNDNKGSVVYIEGVFLDITRQIKKIEESQRLIINSIPSVSSIINCLIKT